MIRDFSANGASRAVEEAIRALLPPGADLGEDLSRLVRGIESAAWGGGTASLSRRRPGTKKQTIDELTKLNELCQKLAQHLSSMHYPAITLANPHLKSMPSTLETLFELWEYATLTGYAAREARQDALTGDLPQPDQPLGNARQMRALAITAECGYVYEYVTDLPATFTNDPITDEPRGPFLDFVGAVLAAFGESGNLAYLARTIREKRAAISAQDLP